MRSEDQVIDAFDMRAIRTLIPEGAPMIVVYDHPLDYPEHYVARLFNGRQGTHLIVISAALGDLLAAKPAEMARISRVDDDPPKVAEIWL